MTELICIVCPKAANLKVDEENGYAVTGNGCPRGAAYGHKELTNPTRVITSTVRVEGARCAALRSRRAAIFRRVRFLRRCVCLTALCCRLPLPSAMWWSKTFSALGSILLPRRTFRRYNCF